MSKLIKFLIKNTEDKGNWSIEANNHKGAYDTVAGTLDEDDHYDCFETPEHRQRAIDTNSLYFLQWYRHTSIGFYSFAAPTYEELEQWVLLDKGEG